MRVSSQLEVGQITETMTVSAAAAILQTDRAEVRTDIPAVQLENLPVPVGRNYQNLFVTVPGISPPENMHSVAVNPARGLAFSSNGTTRNANSIRIEGAISNNLWLPHVAAYVPALEAIESVGVTTSTFDADQGLSGDVGQRPDQERHQRVSRLRVRVSSTTGAQVAALLPAGHRKEARGQPAPVRRHARRSDPPQQGVLLRRLPGHLRPPGGQPLRHGADRRDAQRGLLGVGDADLRPATGAANGSGRTAFAGNIIPRERFDPIVQKLIAGLPLPNLPGLADNYFAPRGLHLRSAQRRRQGELQPDRQAGDRRPSRVARLRVPQPADVRRSGRPAGQLDRGQGRHRPGRHLHLHGQRVARPLADVPGRRVSGRHDDRSHIGADRIDENSALAFSGFPAPTARIASTAGGLISTSPTTRTSATRAAATRPTSTTTGRCSTANATWTKGAHTLKFGGDIVRQAMNRHELATAPAASPSAEGRHGSRAGRPGISSTPSRRSCSACRRASRRV